MTPRIAHVTSVIWTHPSRKKSVRHLAEAVGISPSRLRHLFKKEMGMTVGQYRKLQQLEKAKELLEGFVQVKQVRLLVGWADAGRFSRDFKAAYGETPHEYRERAMRTKYSIRSEEQGTLLR